MPQSHLKAACISGEQGRGMLRGTAQLLWVTQRAAPAAKHQPLPDCPARRASSQ